MKKISKVENLSEPKIQALLNALQLPTYYTELGMTLIQKGTFHPVFEFLQPDEVPEKAVIADLDRKSYREKGLLRGCLCATNSRVFFVSEVKGFFEKTGTPYQKEYLYSSITSAEFDKKERADFAELIIVTKDGEKIRYELLLDQVKDAAEFVWHLRKKIPSYD
ncbi:MAG: PH domain-containing protein [Candidatus Kapabacteria bacterium]|nr:PH domain-containing protein [Candidatus Kapabacteria bacterium]